MNRTPLDVTAYWRRILFKLEAHVANSTLCDSNSYKKSWKIRDTMRFAGLGGLRRVISIVNNMQGIAGKLHRIILLHLGLVTFRFHYGRNRKPTMSMISGLMDVSPSPKNNILFIFGNTRTLQIIREKSQIMFEKD